MLLIALRDDKFVALPRVGDRNSWPIGSPASCSRLCSASASPAARRDPFACCDRRKSLADWFDMYGPTGCYCVGRQLPAAQRLLPLTHVRSRTLPVLLVQQCWRCATPRVSRHPSRSSSNHVDCNGFSQRVGDAGSMIPRPFGLRSTRTRCVARGGPSRASMRWRLIRPLSAAAGLSTSRSRGEICNSA